MVGSSRTNVWSRAAALAPDSSILITELGVSVLQHVLDNCYHAL